MFNPDERTAETEITCTLGKKSCYCIFISLETWLTLALTLNADDSSGKSAFDFAVKEDADWTEHPNFEVTSYPYAATNIYFGYDGSENKFSGLMSYIQITGATSNLAIEQDHFTKSKKHPI